DPGHVAAAELQPHLVHRDHEGRVRRSRRRPAQAPRGSRANGRDGREDPADPRPHRPLRPGRDLRGGTRRADRGTARGGPLADRHAGRGRRSLWHRGPFVRTLALARRRRYVDCRGAELRGSPLPRPHAWPRRLPPRGFQAGDRRRRAVRGLDRPDRLPAKRPPGATRQRGSRALADGQRHRLHPRPRPRLDLRAGACLQPLRQRPRAGRGL
ncbi:MAG: Hypothetical metal-binding enzyme, YcbL homolog, partial [uncultured Sphingomonas sp.]